MLNLLKNSVKVTIVTYISCGVLIVILAGVVGFVQNTFEQGVISATEILFGYMIYGSFFVFIVFLIDTYLILPLPLFISILGYSYISKKHPVFFKPIIYIFLSIIISVLIFLIYRQFGELRGAQHATILFFTVLLGLNVGLYYLSRYSR